MNEKELKILLKKIKEEVKKRWEPIPKGKTVKISALSDELQEAIKKLPETVTFAEVEGVLAFLEQFDR